jgi:hypothetical protein
MALDPRDAAVTNDDVDAAGGFEGQSHIGEHHCSAFRIKRISHAFP